MTSWPNRVQLQELIGARFERSMQRIRSHPYSPIFLRSDISFEMPRIFAAYSGDISGRYIELMSIAGQLGEPVAGLDAFVSRALTYQQPEGYFGATGFDMKRLTEKETKIFWGNGRLLIGLLEYYRFRKDTKVLAAARRLGDFLIACNASRAGGDMADQSGPAGFATTFCSCIEGIARLFADTGDQRYAELTRHIAERLPEALDTFHSHGRLTALRGMADFSVTANDARLLAHVVRQWDAIAAEHVTCLGGIREYFGGACLRDEGCSVSDWAMLSLKLHAITGEERFLQAAEHCFLNHLLANQFSNGGFGSLPFLHEASRTAPKNQPTLTGVGVCGNEGKEAYWCCSFHGPRAFLEAARHAMTMPEPNILDLNLFMPAELRLGEFTVRISTDAGFQCCTLDVIAAPTTPTTVRLRVPSWANGAGATLVQKGGEQRFSAIGAKLILKNCVLRPGDTVKLAVNAAIHTRPAMSPNQRGEIADQESLFFGPLLLGYDTSDDLLVGQGLNPGATQATVILISGHPGSGQERPPQHTTIVAYHDRSLGRTIWASRVFVPVMMRSPDAPLRTVHSIERRAYATLSPEQREEFAANLPACAIPPEQPAVQLARPGR